MRVRSGGLSQQVLSWRSGKLHPVVACRHRESPCGLKMGDEAKHDGGSTYTGDDSTHLDLEVSKRLIVV